MFCPKCGTQLPDGAMFCSSCGNQINVQPTAPMMPVEPVAPVMEVPVMTAPVMEAPAMEAPAMTAPAMTAPVMPVNEPTFNNNGYNPANQFAYNNAPNAMPVNAPVAPMNNKPKKSKAPIFIGLGIGVLVLAIIALVIFLVLPGDKDKKKGKDEKNTTEVVTETESMTEETTTEEPTTEEPTTEEPTVEDEKIDFEDAETLVIKLLNALKSQNLSKASGYIYPAAIDMYVEAGYSADILTGFMYDTLSDPNGNMLDYNVSFVGFSDSSSLEELISDAYMDGYDLESYPSFFMPTDFAYAVVDFTYNDQTSSITFYIGLYNGEYYVLDYDDSEFEIIFETESESESESESASGDAGTTTEFDFDASLSSNYHVFGAPVDGNLTAFEGFSLVAPTDWIQVTNGVTTSDGRTAVIGATSPIATSKIEFLQLLCQSYISQGYENFEFGNLMANEREGYYMEGDYLGTHLYMMFFFNETGDTMYAGIVSTEDVTLDSYNTAKAIAASIVLN